MIANSVLRVMADSMAGLAHLVLRYIDWLARQLMPDTSETEWLDRHGDIWLTNADESTGRKAATFADGVLSLTGTPGTIIPNGTEFDASGASGGVTLQVIEQVFIGSTATPIRFVSLTAGRTGLVVDDTVSITDPITGFSDATIGSINDGIAQETDEELRMRVLERIREPPMGGDAEDYVAWALQVPGVTRAWCAPNEMGIGTVTLRFMCDSLRATDDPMTDGFPLASDVQTVLAHLHKKRPVAVKDFFCVSPNPYPITCTISNLSEDTPAVRAAIDESIKAMLREKAKPSHAINGFLLPPQTVYVSWISEAISAADGVDYFDLMTIYDYPMPNNGAMAVLGTVTYA